MSLRARAAPVKHKYYAKNTIKCYLKVICRDNLQFLQRHYGTHPHLCVAFNLAYIIELTWRWNSFLRAPYEPLHDGVSAPGSLWNLVLFILFTFRFLKHLEKCPCYKNVPSLTQSVKRFNVIRDSSIFDKLPDHMPMMIFSRT